MKTTIDLNNCLNLPDKWKEAIIYDVDFITSNYGDSVSAIFLFGSCSRGTIKHNSDVDILVLSKEPLDRYTRGDIRSELTDIAERVSTDVVFYTIDNFKASQCLLVQNIRKDGLLLWENR